MKDNNKIDVKANKRANNALREWHDKKLGFTPCASGFVKYLSKYIPEYK